MTTENDVVIVAAARTPQGRLKGQLAPLTAVQLGAAAIRGALQRGGIPAEAVDAVLVGQVLQAGAGQNAARQAAIAAGIGWDVHSATINKVCLSGLTAVIDAARMLRLGDATVVVAAGMESMTRAPHLLMNSRDGYAYGSVEVLDHMAFDGLTDAYDRESMGASTERANARYEVTREAQDAVSARSHQRAAAAQAAGVFEAEIVPVEIPQRKGDPVTVSADEGIRADTTVETLAKLRPAFAEAARSPPAMPRRSPTGPPLSSSPRVPSPPNTAGTCWRSWGRAARSPDPTTPSTPNRRGRSRRRCRSRGSRPPTSTSSRSTRRSERSWPGPRPNSGSPTRSSTRTAGASRSVTRSAPRAIASSCTPSTSSCVVAAARRPSRCAVAAVRATRSS